MVRHFDGLLHCRSRSSFIDNLTFASIRSNYFWAVVLTYYQRLERALNCGSCQYKGLVSGGVESDIGGHHDRGDSTSVDVFCHAEALYQRVGDGSDKRMISLKLSGLKKAYGPIQVLHEIDLTIQQGEFIVMVWPSGCGKSTLPKAIAWRERLNSSTIRFAAVGVDYGFPTEEGFLSSASDLGNPIISYAHINGPGQVDLFSIGNAAMPL